MFSSDSECFGLICHGYHGQKIKEYYSSTTPIQALLQFIDNLKYQQILKSCGLSF